MDFDLIQYYCREKYYHTMLTIAETAIRNRPDDAVMKLQYCTALILENRIGEALRELELFALKGDTELAVIVAMIYAQNLCDIPDTEAIFSLENRLKAERKRASELALYYAANFYLQLQVFDQARELMEQIFRLNQSSVRGYLLKGWLELNERKLTVAADCFRTVLSQETQNLNAALGEVLSLSSDDAVHRLNQLIVKHPKLTIPLMEKMKLLLANRDWEQCAELTSRILEIDKANILALEFRILYNLCARGDTEYVKSHYEELISALRHQEPKNWFLAYEFGQVLCRTGGKNSDLLRISIKFIEEALNLEPNNVALNIEMANQFYLLGNYQKSVDICKKVALIDDSATEALIGLIKCRLIDNGLNEEIKQQIDFLLEVYNKDTNPDLLALQATNEPENVAAKLLKKAIELKFSHAENLRFGVKYLIALDTTFILDLLQRFSYVNIPCVLTYFSDYVKRINFNEIKIDKSFQIQVLKKLTDIIPGLVDLWLLLAKVHIDSNENTDAERILKQIIDTLDRSNADANLNLALILIRQKKHREAESTLELCLSQNLNVHSKPLFHFLMGKIKKQKNNYAECVDSMLNALNYMTETDYLKSLDLASLYLDLSQSYQMIRQPTQAAEAIQKATLLLEGSPQEDRILIARADLELWKNNPDQALTLLASIMPKSSLYHEANMKIADIHLKYNKDSSKFVECYKKLADKDPSHENLINLAEAYFSVRKINDAVEVYEKILRKKYDLKLCKKLAELYCKCHQYDKAMRCYREAGPEGSIDLAQLLFQMEQWESAEMTLAHVPLLDKAILLSKIKEKQGDIRSAINILNDAYQIVNRNDSIATQFCCLMAEHEASLHNFEEAIQHYKRALTHCEQNKTDVTSIQISLSKLYLQNNDFSSCQSICSSLLSKDANNEMALLLSGDLSFRKCDFLSASNLFHKLLSKKPDYWLALVRMVEVKRRMGVLSEVNSYLKNAFEVNSSDPGLAYCTGLFHWFNNDLNEAITNFNAVKHDPEWGQQALYNMVEIYLSGLEDHETAQSLLQEIKPNSSEEETNRNLLVNFVLLASKDKQLVEKAMNELTLLGSRDILRIGASLGLAMGYMLQKQPQRARNVLKIVAKTTWQYEEAEYLERCWLLLAEHYAQSGKYELAFELIKKILLYNVGSSKAHELYGMIAEKEHKYGDPIAHYLKAWTLNNQRDPNLGHRLATLYLKYKRYADSISVCHTVLKKNPDYWRIKKDVYEKSLSLLRT